MHAGTSSNILGQQQSGKQQQLPGLHQHLWHAALEAVSYCCCPTMSRHEQHNASPQQANSCSCHFGDLHGLSVPEDCASM